MMNAIYTSAPRLNAAGEPQPAAFDPVNADYWIGVLFFAAPGAVLMALATVISTAFSCYRCCCARPGIPGDSPFFEDGLARCKWPAHYQTPSVVIPAIFLSVSGILLLGSSSLGLIHNTDVSYGAEEIVSNTVGLGDDIREFKTDFADGLGSLSSDIASIAANISLQTGTTPNTTADVEAFSSSFDGIGLALNRTITNLTSVANATTVDQFAEMQIDLRALLFEHGILAQSIVGLRAQLEMIAEMRNSTASQFSLDSLTGNIASQKEMLDQVLDPILLVFSLADYVGKLLLTVDLGRLIVVGILFALNILLVLLSIAAMILRRTWPPKIMIALAFFIMTLLGTGLLLHLPAAVLFSDVCTSPDRSPRQMLEDGMSGGSLTSFTTCLNDGNLFDALGMDRMRFEGIGDMENDFSNTTATFPWPEFTSFLDRTDNVTVFYNVTRMGQFASSGTNDDLVDVGLNLADTGARSSATRALMEVAKNSTDNLALEMVGMGNATDAINARIDQVYDGMSCGFMGDRTDGVIDGICSTTLIAVDIMCFAFFLSWIADLATVLASSLAWKAFYKPPPKIRTAVMTDTGETGGTTVVIHRRGGRRRRRRNAESSSESEEEEEAAKEATPEDAYVTDPDPVNRAAGSRYDGGAQVFQREYADRRFNRVDREDMEMGEAQQDEMLPPAYANDI